jgi:hypothetical protein
MLNEVEDRLSIDMPSCMHLSRFIASGQPAGQEKKGQEDILILPSCIAAPRRSSRSSALLYPSLSDWIVSSSFFLEKVGSLSLAKWAHFR